MDELILHDIKTDKEYNVDFVWCMFPNGKTGYRLEYVDEDAPFPLDLGTLFVESSQAKIVNW